MGLDGPKSCVMWGPDKVHTYSPGGANVRKFNRVRQVTPISRSHSAGSCAKRAELIDWPFGLWTHSSGPKEAQVQSYSPVGANVPL